MAKSNAKEVSKVETTDLSFPDANSFVRRITAADLKGVNIERIATLAGGDMIEGTYLGAGADVEVTDPVTGEVRQLPTHRFQATPDVILRLIESHQLKRELPQYTGKRVRVMKLGQVNTRKGMRVNDFVVAAVK